MLLQRSKMQRVALRVDPLWHGGGERMKAHTLQDAVTLAADLRIDAELQTAITYTKVELGHVRALLKHRGGKDQRLVEDELQVLARLADLKLQAGQR